VASYRLELKLNEVAQAFLRLDRYLSTGRTGQRRDTRPVGRGYSMGLKSMIKKYIPGHSSERNLAAE
jgi:hypothetical protein